MRTTMVLDDKVLKKAMEFSKAKTKSEAVAVALRWFVQTRKQPKVRVRHSAK